MHPRAGCGSLGRQIDSTIGSPDWTCTLVQRTCCHIILGDNFEGYEDALAELNLQRLSDRRNMLCLNFARKAMKSEKYKNWFEVKAQISIETISEKNYVVAIRYDCNEPVDYRSGSTQLDQCLQYGTLLVVCKHFSPVRKINSLLLLLLFT